MKLSVELNCPKDYGNHLTKKTSLTRQNVFKKEGNGHNTPKRSIGVRNAIVMA